MNYVDPALACAERGWLVFPVAITYKSGGLTEKRPMVRWTLEATREPDAVRALWSRYPTARVGIVTGADSGLYVVDVDNPDAARQLDLATGYEMPTNRPGGYHVYFGPPEDGQPVSNSAADGLDVRGDGGMVVCWGFPPMHELYPLPRSVADWARGRSSAPDPTASRDGLEVIHWPGGGSDAWVVSMIGTMCKRGFQEGAALSAILYENDNGRFDPPCEVEWLADKVRGVYARYYTGRTISAGLLEAIENARDRA